MVYEYRVWSPCAGARGATHSARFYPRSDAMALRCAILDDYQNVALKLADWSKLKDVETKVYTDAVRRTDADTIRDCKDLRDRRDDARAHALSPRGDRGAAQAQAPDHHRGLQRLDRHEGLPGARHHGLRHHQPRQPDHRHRLRPDAGADPADRLGERPDEGRRALAAHARHGHRGQDAGASRPRQARRARGRRRQGVRHEGASPGARTSRPSAARRSASTT